MDAFRIQGGTRLAGSVEIEGMKNAILPMMAASILATEGTLVLENVPQLRDVTVMLRILETLGVKGGTTLRKGPFRSTPQESSATPPPTTLSGKCARRSSCRGPWLRVSGGAVFRCPAAAPSVPAP